MISLAAIAAVSIVQGNEDAERLSTAAVRNLVVAGERPRVVILARSGTGVHERDTALAASVTMNVSADGLMITPFWSAVRVTWSSASVETSKVISQDSCPALLEVIGSLRHVDSISPSLPLEPRSKESAPAIPDMRLHRSFTVWTAASQTGEGFADAQAEYSAVGGPLAQIVDAAVVQLEPCWEIH